MSARHENLPHLLLLIALAFSTSPHLHERSVAAVTAFLRKGFSELFFGKASRISSFRNYEHAEHESLLIGFHICCIISSPALMRT